MSAAECMEDGTAMVPAVGPYTTHLPDRSPIELPAVSGWKCPKCGDFVATGKELRLETIQARMALMDLYPEEAPLMMLLAAPAPDAKAVGTVRSKTVFHKMLFDAWEKLDHTTHVFGKFNPARQGPMYHDFDIYEMHLALRKLVKVTEPVPKVQGAVYRASREAIALGSELLEIAPDDWREAMMSAKRDLFHLTARKAAERVHERRPEWQAKRARAPRERE